MGSIVTNNVQGVSLAFCFMMFPVTTEKPIQALVVQVKKSDRGDSFKRKLSWALRQLKVFDAKYQTKVCLFFLLYALWIYLF